MRTVTQAARRRDRRVYLASHPVLFTVLAALRRAPVRRIGRTVLVNAAPAYRQALTRVPMDRAAAGTTGAAARAAGVGGVLFDQDGTRHRHTRHDVGERLGSAGVEQLRPVWTPWLRKAAGALGQGRTVDVVELALAVSGATSCALLGITADPVEVARAACAAAAVHARAQTPGRRRGDDGAAAARLAALLGPSAAEAMLVVAAVNTTVAGLPRAVAWCADAHLWTDAGLPLVDELLRVVAPTPLLPRVAAADATVDGCPVFGGDRLILVARHAVEAHSRDPDPASPAPPQVSSLVFGAGPHACPGARLAREQLLDVVSVLAPFRPVVVRARADRRAALPGWRSLLVAATVQPSTQVPA
jgi:cytochrome P450